MIYQFFGIFHRTSNRNHMVDYDNLDTYDGDSVHDGRGDFDYNDNTGELSGLFEDTALD